MEILKARKGEGSRPWSAGAGATVTTTALAVVPYTLQKLRELLPAANGWLDWSKLPGVAGDILFFEAFVSGSAKAVDHASDALRAADTLAERLSTGEGLMSDLNDPEVFNLLGAALLRTKWTTDVSYLEQSCLVVRAT